jgi:hypothetical protein
MIRSMASQTSAPDPAIEWNDHKLVLGKRDVRAFEESADRAQFDAKGAAPSSRPARSHPRREATALG